MTELNCNLFAGKEWRHRSREGICERCRGEGESRMNGEHSINIHTLPRIRWIGGETLPCSREPRLVLCDDVGGWDGCRGGRLGMMGLYV